MNRVRIGQNVGILVKCYSGGNAESFDNALIEYVKIVSRINPSVVKNIDDYSINRFDEIRLSNIARWTSNFTPPTQAY